MIAWILEFLLLVLMPIVPPGTPSYELKLPFTPIYKMISDHGNVLVVVNKQLSIRALALPSGRELRNVDGHNAVGGAISPSGKWLAIATRDNKVILYSTATKAKKMLDVKKHVETMTFLDKGLLQVNKTLWDISVMRPVVTLKTEFGPVTAVAISRDGTRLATGGGDTVVRLYDTKSWKLISHYNGLKLEPFGLSFTPDGSRLIVGGIDDRLTMLNVSDFKEIKSFHSGESGVTGVEPVGKSGWVAVHYIDARTDKPKAWRLVNINSGSNKSLSGAKTVVKIIDGKILCFRFEGKTLTATIEELPHG